MCLVSRQLGFVISPKFSYYLVPRSTTSPLILSYESIQTSDVSRFFSFPSSFLLLLFFLFFFLSLAIGPIGSFAPHFPLKIPSSLLLLGNQRASHQPFLQRGTRRLVQARHLIRLAAEEQCEPFRETRFQSVSTTW